MHCTSWPDHAFEPLGLSTYEVLIEADTGWQGEGRRHPSTIPNLSSRPAGQGKFSLQMRPCLGRPGSGEGIGQGGSSPLWASVSPGALGGVRTRGSLRPLPALGYHEVAIGAVKAHHLTSGIVLPGTKGAWKMGTSSPSASTKVGLGQTALLAVCCGL